MLHVCILSVNGEKQWCVPDLLNFVQKDQISVKTERTALSVFLYGKTTQFKNSNTSLLWPWAVQYTIGETESLQDNQYSNL